jgi:hypothetical protein
MWTGLRYNRTAHADEDVSSVTDEPEFSYIFLADNAYKTWRNYGQQAFSWWNSGQNEEFWDITQ